MLMSMLRDLREVADVGVSCYMFDGAEIRVRIPDKEKVLNHLQSTEGDVKWVVKDHADVPELDIVHHLCIKNAILLITTMHQFNTCHLRCVAKMAMFLTIQVRMLL